LRFIMQKARCCKGKTHWAFGGPAFSEVSPLADRGGPALAAGLAAFEPRGEVSPSLRDGGQGSISSGK